MTEGQTPVPCTHYLGICFEPADASNSPSIFGFPEFFAAMALLAIAYTFSDEKYKFRMNVAKYPVPRVFPYYALVIGLSLLAVKFYFMGQFPIPRVINAPVYHESLLAFITVALISYWIFVAFVSPPNFNKGNSIRFGQSAFNIIAGGTGAQLHAVGYEIGRSSKSIIAAAHKKKLVRDFENGGFRSEFTKEAEIARQILSFIGNRRFCHIVARELPWVPAQIFHELAEQGVHEIQISQFANNISRELIFFEDSPLHAEDEYYKSGLVAHIKPITRYIYGNYKLIEEVSRTGSSQIAIGQPDWTPQSWNTYIEVSKLYFDSYVDEKGYQRRSMSLLSLTRDLGFAVMDAHKLEKMEGPIWKSIEYLKVQGAVEFLKHSLNSLDARAVHGSFKRDDNTASADDVFDILAELAFETIVAVSNVNRPDFNGWVIQHNLVWGPLFHFLQDGKSTRIFYARLRRKLYQEVFRLTEYPNFRSAHLMALCLNVVGLKDKSGSGIDRHERALGVVIRRWISLHYLELRSRYPKVADACLCGRLTFDQKNRCITKTYEGLFGKRGTRVHLRLRSSKSRNLSARR